MSGGAPEGNKNGLKLKEPDVRQEAYRQYCAHLAKGKSKKSFVFKHPQLTCVYKTIDKYIEEDPVEFPPLHMQVAKSEGYAVWEEIAGQGAKGVNKEVSPPVLQMVMRNKFDWDRDLGKKEDHSSTDGLSTLEKFFKAISPKSSEPLKDKEE